MTITLLTGDCRDVLPTLPSNSVHTVITSPPYWALRSYLDASHPDKHRELGSEATPDEYLAAMVGVFREVRRVLRPDGTCWVNIGDSYNSNPVGLTAAGFQGYQGREGIAPVFHAGERLPGTGKSKTATLKPKDLLLMPARLALALQADGWWVRSDIIWAKPNPMPESCTDRPTSAHEHVFLLTKAARYFYDNDAVREPNTEGTHSRGGEKINGRDALIRSGHWNTLPPTENPAGRNLRNVWTLATESFSGSHFATYPTALVERCIRAGTSERGCCAACGAPHVRMLDVETRPNAPSLTGKYNGDGRHRTISGGVSNDARARIDRGWSPSCQCNADTQPCTVLDPFLGSGTTALVADRLQRHCIGIDLSLTYADMAQRRLEADCPLFTSWAPAEDPEEARMADLFAEAAE